MAIPHGQWHDVTIEFGGEEGATLTVSRGPRGGTLTQVLSADTALTNESTDIGFGVGEKADYLFDDVRFFDPTATGEQSTIGRRYAYDARGRRVAETTFEDGVAETTYFVYDGHRVIEELDGNGNVTASYVYGNYIDEVLQMRRDTDPGAAGMEDHYYLHDDLFNVVGLADASGALRERYEYADYGMPAVYDAANNPLAASAYQNAYLFNGRRFDAATGLYYYRTRYMDPELGRFISRDTIGLWGDEANLGNPYSYVGNNPWSRLDPFGEVSLWRPEWNHDYPKGVITTDRLRGWGIDPNNFDINAASRGTWMPNQLHNAAGTGIHNLPGGLDYNSVWMREIAMLERNGVKITEEVLEASLAKIKVMPQFETAFKVGERATVAHGASRKLKKDDGQRAVKVMWARAEEVGLHTTQAGRLAQYIAKSGTLRVVGKVTVIAGVILAYQSAKAQGFDESEARAYAASSVVGGDLVVDAMNLAGDTYWDLARDIGTNPVTGEYFDQIDAGAGGQFREERINIDYLDPNVQDALIKQRGIGFPGTFGR